MWFLLSFWKGSGKAKVLFFVCWVVFANLHTVNSLWVQSNLWALACCLDFREVEAGLRTKKQAASPPEPPLCLRVSVVLFALWSRENATDIGELSDRKASKLTACRSAEWWGKNGKDRPRKYGYSDQYCTAGSIRFPKHEENLIQNLSGQLRGKKAAGV